MDEYLNKLSQDISAIHIVMGSLVEVPAVCSLHSQATSKEQGSTGFLEMFVKCKSVPVFQSQRSVCLQWTNSLAEKWLVLRTDLATREDNSKSPVGFYGIGKDHKWSISSVIQVGKQAKGRKDLHYFKAHIQQCVPYQAIAPSLKQ